MMTTCPKCGEKNGRHNEQCFRCGAPLAREPDYQKLCPRCGLVYTARATACEKCAGPLSVHYERESPSFSGESSLRWWMILIALLWSPLGVLVGFGIRSSYDEQAGGKMIRLSLTVIGIGLGFGLLFGGCSAFF